MRILVTGAKGFIGLNLMRYLGGIGYNVHGIDIERELSALLRVHVPFYPDVIVHCGAQTSVVKSMSMPESDAKTNILGTIRLARLFPKSKFIFLSTSAVYGEGSGHTEEGITNPKSAYAISKLAAEYYVKMLVPNYTILRLANVVGDFEKANPNVFDVFKKAKVLKIFGDGSQRRDFIGVAEVCNVVERCIKSTTVGVFNIGSGRTRSILDVAKSFGKKIIFKPKRIGEIHTLSMDISKAIKEGYLTKRQISLANKIN